MTLLRLVRYVNKYGGHIHFATNNQKYPSVYAVLNHDGVKHSIKLNTQARRDMLANLKRIGEESEAKRLRFLKEQNDLVQA